MSRIIFIIVVPFFLISMQGQTKFSANALTGKGSLTLKGDEIKLQPEVYSAFKQMQEDALREGINIKIVSGYRSYERQLEIWNKKYKFYTGKGFSPKEAVFKIIEYSTLPGSSRHHWGTDIDIIDGNVTPPDDVLLEKHFLRNGVYAHLKKWMDKNAHKYGFYIVYNNNLNRTGFKYEPWHYSYKKVSKKMLKALKLHTFLSNYINKNQLLGAEILTNEFLLNYYNNYVYGISSFLK